MSARVQLRDYEILRTLARLRFMTTRELVTTFFSSPSAGRRRLSILSQYGWITPHTKGLTDPWGFRAWRLTPEGIDTVAQAFRDEVIPDGLADRLAGASLFNIQHRFEVNRLYLRLVGHGGGQAPSRGGAARASHARTPARAGRWPADSAHSGRLEAPRETGGDRSPPAEDGHRLNRARSALVASEGEIDSSEAREEALRAMRERAGSFSWRPDGDEVYKFDYRGEAHQIVPDAVVLPNRAPKVFFVELDRATKVLRRIRENFDRYAALFRDLVPTLFPGRTPFLLYVVPSNARRAGVQREGEGAFRPAGPFRVFTFPDAVSFLRGELGFPAERERETEPPGSPPAFPIDIARELYRDLHALAEKHPDVRARSLELLHRAHRALAAGRSS